MRPESRLSGELVARVMVAGTTLAMTFSASVQSHAWVNIKSYLASHERPNAHVLTMYLRQLTWFTESWLNSISIMLDSLFKLAIPYPISDFHNPCFFKYRGRCPFLCNKVQFQIENINRYQTVGVTSFLIDCKTQFRLFFS